MSPRTALAQVPAARREGRLAEGWHALDVEEAAARLGTDPDAGLSSSAAAERLARYGPNRLEAAAAARPWRLFLDQFRSVLVLILLAALALSVVLGHLTEAAVIAAIVLLAAVLGFLQEYRAERAIEALRRMAAPTATVLRDGQETGVAAHELVPGDVLLLRAGDRVSADGRLVEAVNLQVEESALTGESQPVEKRTDPAPGDAPVAERGNMVYAGTAVTYGRGRALVVATGMSTEIGGVARLLETIERGKTPLQESFARVAMVLARAAPWSSCSSSPSGSSGDSRSSTCSSSAPPWPSRSSRRRCLR